MKNPSNFTGHIIAALVLIVSIPVLTACPSHRRAGSAPKDVTATKQASTESPIENIRIVDRKTCREFRQSYDYIHFGMIGHDVHSFKEDTLVFPPISGLAHHSAYAMCEADTCFAEYSVLALRCPKNGKLYQWLSDRVHEYICNCAFGNARSTYDDTYQIDIKKKYFNSAEKICQYYISELEKIYSDWHCRGEGDPGMFNEQEGLLITDCWHSGDLYTFYESHWYDWLSAGNNCTESFLTVDSRSGKKLELHDIVAPDQYDRLSSLMMPRLKNGNDELLINQGTYTAEDKDVLSGANGCGFIEEGLIIYFFPYNLGSGAEGAHEAIIPYDELQDIIKPEWLEFLK